VLIERELKLLGTQMMLGETWDAKVHARADESIRKSSDDGVLHSGVPCFSDRDWFYLTDPTE
jgi:hypothetical protein